MHLYARQQYKECGAVHPQTACPNTAGVAYLDTHLLACPHLHHQELLGVAHHVYAAGLQHQLAEALDLRVRCGKHGEVGDSVSEWLQDVVLIGEQLVLQVLAERLPALEEEVRDQVPEAKEWAFSWY
jgi:hypothetical protein